jgi:exonuclease III
MTALPPDIAGPPLLSDPRLVLAPNFKPLGFRMSLPDGERRIRVIPTVRRVCRTFLRELPYWEALIAAPELVSGEHTLAIGDFNTCRPHLDERGAIDPTAHYMDKIELIGYCDLWRCRYPTGREFSWHSTRGNGFRIDHAFLSACLAAHAGEISYSHEERIAGLSDHSPLILELDI